MRQKGAVLKYLRSNEGSVVSDWRRKAEKIREYVTGRQETHEDDYGDDTTGVRNAEAVIGAE